MELSISKTGDVRHIYTEQLALGDIGLLSINRASNVEPDSNGQWWADMSPSGGGRLGPFKLRSEALDSEVAWLRYYTLNLI